MLLAEDMLPLDCAKAEPRSLPVDTVVVHFISALHWDSLSADDLAFLADTGVVLPAAEPDARKFHPAYCHALLVKAKLSYHYLIGRDGSVIRLVTEDRVASHAGVSRMPTDGREWVNSFSIGVSFTAIHPDDDPAVAVGAIRLLPRAGGLAGSRFGTRPAWQAAPWPSGVQTRGFHPLPWQPGLRAPLQPVGEVVAYLSPGVMHVATLQRGKAWQGFIGTGALWLVVQRPRLLSTQEPTP